MKTKKRKPNNYNFGGMLNSISPLLGLINPALGMGAGLAGSMINQPQGAAPTQRPVQQNNNPYGFAYGGELDPISNNTVKVNANNTTQRDSVTIPGIARVDNNETISNTNTGAYVFSDALKIPNTSTTFAKANEQIAKSDKIATEKISRYNDPEAKNTENINSYLREVLKEMNDNVRSTIGRSASDDAYTSQSSSKSKSSDMLYERANGGKLPGYILGGNASFYGGNPGLGKIGNVNIMDMLTAFTDTLSNDLNAKPTGNFTPGNLPGISGFLPNSNQLRDGNIIGAPNRLPTPGLNPLIPTFTEDNPPLDSLANLKLNSAQLYDDKVGTSGNVNPVDNTDPNITDPAKPNNPLNIFVDYLHHLKRIMPKGNNKLPLALQGLEAAINAATLLRGIDKEPTYRETAPINLRQVDPSQALMRNQNTFAGTQRDIRNSVGGGNQMSNLQQAYANKYGADAQVADTFSQRNVDLADRFDNKNIDRDIRNIKYDQYTNATNAANSGAFFNALRQGVGGSIGNMGRALAQQQENKLNMELLFEAYPGLRKLFG